MNKEKQILDFQDQGREFEKEAILSIYQGKISEEECGFRCRLWEMIYKKGVQKIIRRSKRS